MYKSDRGLIYSPSDLNAFLENECVTWLDRFNLEYPGELQADEVDEQDELIRRAGDEHENAFLAGIVDNGSDVLTIDRQDPAAFEKTLQAMREGREVIYQARLGYAEFAGWADFLYRVDGPSALGPWHYEVWDTKLARHMKPYFAVQLCCYSEMLDAIQRRLPERMGIILGNGERKPLRLQDYSFYYRAIKRAFLAQQNSFDRNKQPLFPGLADYRRWSGHVNRMLKARDDLSLVANMRAAQVEKLAAAGITTLHGLATSALETVPKMAKGTFERLRAQSRLQCASEPGHPPAYEILTPDPDAIRHGFALLPPASPGDLCFDIEGYPLVDGGLEYLLGVVSHDGTGLAFRDWWAHDRQQERASFEAFVDWAYARWKQDPSIHIYHYAAYETTALKRLMCRNASRESEIDELLRNHVFVDLYTVVRQALLIGEPGYSLKNVEHLYSPAREGEVSTAGASMVYYNRWLTLRDGEDWRNSQILKLIRDYNQADCESTWQLVQWLRERQVEAGLPYVPPEPPDDIKEEAAGRSALAAGMLAAIPEDRSGDPERWRVHELLAHLVEFHRRERKSLHWKLFERMKMTQEDLIADLECLGGAERTNTTPVMDKQSLIHEYRFPMQESKLREGSKCRLASGGKMRLVVESIDYERQLLTIKRGKKNGPPDRLSLIPDEIIDARCIEASIERTAREYQATGELPPALSDFLYRNAPRLAGLRGGPIIPNGEDVTAGAVAAALRLDGTTLCVQGPPGSGKTTTGGQLIAELLRRGKRVGISSNGHEAICVLMKAAADAADRLNIHFTGANCGEKDREAPHPAIKIVPVNADVFRLPGLPMLVGGTAWVFSHEEARGRFDYLFIDEAGQVAAANLVGMAPATRNLLLLGDQMQLSQPIQGVHPGESGQSILDYYLGDHATVPEHMGIFLPTTWRMRPEICGFISDAMYEGRLKVEACTSERSIRFLGPVRYVRKPAGILHVPVVHSGNVYDCDEEAEVIRDVIAELTGHLLVDGPRTAARPITGGDILVVAPFNLQVLKLKAALPGVRVGTVDKFQGQQAPVVIFSMTSSEGDTASRGVEFLFDKQRLNVAISRAQVLAVVVSNPNLASTRCSSLKQMSAVNVYCRAVEAAGSLGAAAV
jgi:predicted RecB family nuclease